MTTDRTAGNIAASGSVSWILKLYNAAHSQNVPNNMFLAIHPITSDWQEGRGLDMEGYSFKGSANWVTAKSGSSGIGTAATATITITDYTELNGGDKVNLVATDGTNYDFVCGENDSTLGTWEATDSNNQTAANLATVINTASGPAGTRFTATAAGAVVTATQATAGVDGNTTVTLTDSGTVGMSSTNFTGGEALINITGFTGGIDGTYIDDNISGCDISLDS